MATGFNAVDTIGSHCPTGKLALIFQALFTLSTVFNLISTKLILSF